jgi:thymidylate kinase
MRVNLFGAPGSGKTTLAAELFVHFKKKNVNCEIVNELAREWAYLNRPILSCDQIFLFASQMNREDTLLSRNKADMIITDSPVYLNAFYGIIKDAKLFKGFQSLSRYFDLKYKCVNLFCKLNENFIYSNKGRYHSKEESEKLETSMLEDVSSYYRSILMDVTVIDNSKDRLDQAISIIESEFFNPIFPS